MIATVSFALEIIHEIESISKEFTQKRPSLSRMVNQVKLLSNILEDLAGENKYKIMNIISLLISIRDFIVQYTVDMDLNKFVLLLSYREKYYATMSLFHQSIFEIALFYRPDIPIYVKKERELNLKSMFDEITCSAKEFLEKLHSLSRENTLLFQNFRNYLLDNYSNGDMDKDVLFKLKSLDGTDHRHYSLEETLIEEKDQFEAGLEHSDQDLITELDDIQSIIFMLKKILYDPMEGNSVESSLSLLEKRLIDGHSSISLKLLNNVHKDLNTLLVKQTNLDQDLRKEAEVLISTVIEKVHTLISLYNTTSEVGQVTNFVDQYRSYYGEDNIFREMLFASSAFLKDRISPLKSTSISLKEWIDWKTSFLLLSNSKETETETQNENEIKIYFTQLLEQKVISFDLFSYNQDLEVCRSDLSRLINLMNIYKTQANYSNQLRLRQYCQNLDNKFRHLIELYYQEAPSKYDQPGMIFFSLTNFHVLLLKLRQEIAKNNDFNRYNNFQQQIFHEMILFIDEKFPSMINNVEYSDLVNEALETERNRPAYLFLFPDIISGTIISFLSSYDLSMLHAIYERYNKHEKAWGQAWSSLQLLRKSERSKREQEHYESAVQRDWWLYGHKYKMQRTDRLVISLDQLHDGRIAYTSKGPIVHIVHLRNGMCEKKFYLTEPSFASPDFVLKINGGRKIGTKTNNTIHIWDIERLVQNYPIVWECQICCTEYTKEIRNHNDNFPIVFLVELSDGKIAMNGSENSIDIRSIDTGEIELSLLGHSEPVTALVQLPDGRLVSGSETGLIKIWNLHDGVCETTLKGHQDKVNTIVSLGFGKIASGSAEETIKIWNLENGKCERTLLSYHGALIALRDDGRIAYGSKDFSIIICNIHTGVSERILIGHTKYVSCLLQLTDGRIASASDDLTVRIWD